MINWRRLVALCRKETIQIFRDPSSNLIAFVLPVIMLFIFGYGINLDSTKVKVGLVLEDSGRDARLLAQSFTGSPYLLVTQVGSRSEVEALLTAGKVRGAVIIPADFGSLLERPGAVAPVQILTDGAEPNTATFVENYTRAVWQHWLDQRARERGETVPQEIDLQVRIWFNPSAISRNYLVPGSITLIMTVVGALLTSLVIAREWERGTMEAMLATPISRAELLLSKLLPYYVLGMVSLLVCVGMAIMVLGVPFRGSLAMLLCIGTFFLFSALGLGLLLSTVTRNQFNAAQSALNVAFMPAMMLSGFIYEISSIPPFLRATTYLIPAKYFVASMQTLFQAGDVWAILGPNLLFLIAASVFFLGLTARKTRRRLDS
ncbi:MAG TPA: ABC transporter permease [Candidatus Limnocylindria bacterium]|nr:ABC transporter permease [Candidatus Limnocylindria bacterium]